MKYSNENAVKHLKKIIFNRLKNLLTEKRVRGSIEKPLGKESGGTLKIEQCE